MPIDPIPGPGTPGGATLSDTPPLAVGEEADAGESTEASRADHVHEDSGTSGAGALPFAAETRPWYLDAFWGFFKGRGYDATAGTTSTTVASTAAQYGVTVVTADATGFKVGEPIVLARGTASQQTVVIESISTNTLTVFPKLLNAHAAGVTVDHIWANDTHPLDSPGYTALAHWIANARQKNHVNGTPMIAGGDMQSSYTDANAEANVPVSWESLDAANVSFLVATWNSASRHPNARSGNGGYFSSTAQDAGVRSLSSIPVQAGMVLHASMQAKSTAGSAVYQIVDKDNPTTVIATSGVIGGSAQDTAETYGNLGKRTTVRFVVPPGVTDIEARIIQSTASAVQLYFDDFRIVRDRQTTVDDRYVLEDFSRPLVLLGDSWGLNLAAKLQSSLRTRTGTTEPTVVDASVSGENLAEMNARLAADVIAESPRYCLVVHGPNDLGDGRSQAQMEGDIDTFVATMRANGIIPVVLGIPPLTSVLSTALTRNDAVRARADLAAAV